MQTLKTWTETCCVTALDNFKTSREVYYANPEATLYIGSASSRMYKFVRHEIGVPFMSNKSISSPRDDEGDFTWSEPDHDSKRGVTMGGIIAKVYHSMRTDQLYHHVALSISDVHDYTSAAETALGANKNKFSYSMTEVRELTGWGGKSPKSLSGDEKNDAAQAQNISSSATVVDDTSYLLETRGRDQPEGQRGSGHDTKHGLESPIDGLR
jgi:hypothetical protein